MSTRRFVATNRTTIYFIAFVVIVVAFLLLGGGSLIKGMAHGSRSMGMAGWDWTTILISMGIGFILGLLVSRRKW